MPRVVYGDRIARDGVLRLGCSIAVFDAARAALLLTRRSDTHQWCLPGGGVNAGESVSEALVREVAEETGLAVEVAALLGVYSNPDCVVVYPDGNRYHMIALNFEGRISGGSLRRVTEETEDARFVAPTAIQSLDVMSLHLQRILDAFAYDGRTFIR